MRRLLTLALLLFLLLPAPARADPAPALPDGVWPLAPRPEVVHGFDPPSSVWGAGHRGVDLLGRPGQPVLAAAAGRVTFAGMLAGRGVVVVDHGGVRTTYEPVDAGVSVGQRVVAGQPIGTLRSTLSHCFPRACLHWGLLAGDRYLDPLRLVGAGPVRLLPLAPSSPPAGWSSPVETPSLGWSSRHLGWSSPVETPPPGPPSRARVGLLEGPSQAVGADVGVDLGRGQ